MNPGSGPPVEDVLDAEARRQRVAALGGAPTAEKRAALLDALGDVDWRVRKEAIVVACALVEPWHLEDELVRALAQGDNVGLRNAALEAFSHLGERSLEPLLGALPKVPSSARKFVVAALGGAGRGAAPALVEASQDPDPNTAQAAVEALARVGGPIAETHLLGQLTAPDPVRRLAALEGLERLAVPVTVADLRALLDDRLVRRGAVRMLRFSRDREAPDVLFDALEEAGSPRGEGVARDAAASLGRLVLVGLGGGDDGDAWEAVTVQRWARRTAELPEDARELLRAIGADDQAPGQGGAVALLLLARDPSALPLAASLAASDRLRPPTLEALRRWGEGAVEPLLRIAGTDGPHAGASLLLAAELAVSAPGAKEAILGAIRAALESVDRPRVVAAATAASVHAQAQDASRLVGAARRHPEAVGRAVAATLEKLAVSHPEEVAAALAELPMEGPAAAVLLPVVATLDGPAATDRLQAALNAEDPAVRRGAVLSLELLEPRIAVELAAFALADEDIDVQTAAVSALSQAGRSELRAIDSLRVALRSDASPVVAGAARALGELGDRDSIPALRELARTGKPGLAVAALRSLRQLGDESLQELLGDALGRDDEELVKEALRAIAESDTPRRDSRILLALEHPVWHVRALAAELLATSRGGSPERREVTLLALSDRLAREDDPSVADALVLAQAALREAAEH